MNSRVEQSMDAMQQKMLGHIGMMSFSYSQFCVKADPMCLLGVEFEDGAAVRHVEDMALTVLHNEEGEDSWIDLIPKESEDRIPVLSQGMAEYFPEFIQSVGSQEADGDEEEERRKALEAGGVACDGGDDDSGGTKFLRLTIPEVDDDRRKFIEDGVKTIHDATSSRVKAVYDSSCAEIALLSAGESKEELEETKQALEELRKQYEGMMEELTADKYREVEEANARYHEKQARTGDDDAESKKWSGKACQSLKME